MFKALEYFWLAVAVVSLPIAIFIGFTSTFKEALGFLVISVASVLMYYVRRKFRIGFEKRNQQ